MRTEGSRNKGCEAEGNLKGILNDASYGKGIDAERMCAAFRRFMVDG